jgi:FAD-dependent oxidoreductase domain-containing protein 1
VSKPRAYKFETDHFEKHCVAGAGASLPAVQEDECKNTLPGLYDQNDLDGNPIIGPWEGECENFYGLMHAPATGPAIAELILHRHFQTLDLTRLGGKRSPRTGLFRRRATSDACPLQVRSTAARVFSMCRLTCSA